MHDAEEAHAVYGWEEVTMMQSSFTGSEMLLTTLHPMHQERELRAGYKRQKHRWFASSGAEVQGMAPGLNVVKVVPFFNKKLLDFGAVPKEAISAMEKLPANYSMAVLLRFE